MPAGWQPPGAPGQTLLREATCAFGADVGGTEPALLRGVFTEAQLESYSKDTLLRRTGGSEVRFAHPAHHVLAQGNAEHSTPLRDFVRGMDHLTPSNASVVFDATFGVAERMRGVPGELAAALPVRVLSLGGDGAGLGFHRHGRTLLGLLHGHKLWLVARPGVRLPPALLEPVHGHGYQLVARLRAAESHGVAWCVQPPNSAVWLPAQWTHATVNLGGAVALGLQSDETDADGNEEAPAGEDADEEACEVAGGAPLAVDGGGDLDLGLDLEELLIRAQRAMQDAAEERAWHALMRWCCSACARSREVLQGRILSATDAHSKG